jgi:hypothetical protein
MGGGEAMPIEKRGNMTEQDICKLVKFADAEEKIVLYELDEVLDKPAVAFIATGPRAVTLRKVMEELSNG